MAKYIDADALKEKLKKDYGDTHNAVSVSFFVTFLTSSYINNMPAADVEPVRKWIPCSEQLPESGQLVLVWYEYFRYGNYNRMYQTYGIGVQYGGFWSGDVNGAKAKCLAWMPLPEPPKMDGGSE